MRQFHLNPANRISYTLLFLLCGGLLVLSSCKKDQDYKDRNTAGGPPTIERVRLSDPTTTDSSLKQAGLGSEVVIVGTNLANAQSVTFNGYPVSVNPTYATNNYLIVTISDSVPTVATNPNVSDTLKVITPLGTAAYHFKTLPPRPVVNQIGNEYSKEGETITLYGKYFFFIDSVAFPGEKYVTSGFTTSPNGSALTVTIPTGIDPAQGDVRVHSASGWSAVGSNTKLYDISGGVGMILDWDSKMSNFGWGIDAGKKVTNSYAGITPVAGNYGVIDMSVPGNWGWSNDKVIDMDNWGTGVIFPTTPAGIYDPNAPLANFNLKFEMAATKPVGDLLLQVTQGDFQLSAPLKDYVMSADGKWYTVSVNLGNLTKGSAKLAKYKDLTANQTLRIVISNSGSADVPATMAIDNIRIVRVQ